jgi:hypothetical protein
MVRGKVGDKVWGEEEVIGGLGSCLKEVGVGRGWAIMGGEGGCITL